MVKMTFNCINPMKKNTCLFVTVLVSTFLLGITACTRVTESLPNENEPITLRFKIAQADDATTRALLGETSDGKKYLQWEDGDHIGTFSVGLFPQKDKDPVTVSNNNAGTVEVDAAGYTLNVQTFNAGSITDIYSYFPYSASAGKNKEAAVITIPESQIMNESGFDADAMPMAGIPVSVDLSTVANTDTPCGTIYFNNLGSIIRFKIYSSVATDETLTSVKFVTAGGVGGAFSIDLTAVDPSDENTLAITPTSNTVAAITTTCTTHPAIGTGKSNAIDVYMVVAPGSYSNTQVVVTTSAHTYTLNASGEKTFTRSHVKPMNVDIQNGTPGELPATETWTKVTTADDFTAGTYYILRADGNYYVPNAPYTSNNGPALVPYTSGNEIVNAMRWTATVSGNGLIFESVANPGNYLGSSNVSEAKSIRVNDTFTGASASTVWSFAVVSDNDNTYYTATAGGGRYLISYGNSDWRYYTSASSSNIPAEFYKLTIHDSRIEVELSFDEDEINQTTTNYSDFTGQVASASPNVSDITTSISYSMSGDAIGTIDASTGVVTLNGTAGTATVTASFAGDQVYQPASASYTVNVKKSYIKATEIVSGTKYLIVGVKANQTYLATPIPSNKDYAYPSGYEVTSSVVDANTIVISGEEDYLFEITASESGYTIKQPDNRFLYATGNYHTLNVGTTQGVWSFEKQLNDSFKITLSGTYIQFGQDDHLTFGRWSSDQEGASLPFLYVFDDGKSDAGITYTPASSTITYGEELTQPALSDTHGLVVSYVSDATDVATVTSNGVISVVGAGTATITASWTEQEISGVTYRAGSTSFTLTVNKATPVIAAFNNPTTTVAVSGTVTNTTTISPNSLSITYTSSNSSVATVDAATGTVTGVANGTSIISATFAGNSNYNAATPQTYEITVGTGAGDDPDPVDKSYSFAFTTIGSTGWSTSYADHRVYNDDVVTIDIKSASKQTSNITDYPVTKAGDVIVVLKEGTMSAVSFALQQWTTKAKTVSLQYSTDGGATFRAMSPAVSSTNFTLSSSTLPTGTNAVKMVQGNTSNQVGLEGVSFTYTHSN